MFNYFDLDENTLDVVSDFKSGKFKYPILIYSSYDKESNDLAKLVADAVPITYFIDLFDHPCISLMLPTYRSTTLYYWGNSYIKMMDIPLAIRMWAEATQATYLL